MDVGSGKVFKITATKITNSRSVNFEIMLSVVGSTVYLQEFGLRRE